MVNARSADDWRAEGQAHFDAGRWEQAAAAFERAVAIDPACADAWYRLGNARQEQALHQAAIECFERVVSADVTHARAWNNIGVSREQLGDDGGAADAYRRAIDASPTLLAAFLNLAHLAVRIGDNETTADVMERAAVLEPGDATIWEKLGHARRALGQGAPAEQAVRKACEIYLKQAEAAGVRGDHATAEALYTAVLKYFPGEPVLTHMRDGAQGKTTVAPPAGYVAALFDGYAGKYDEHMVGVLGYQAADAVAQAILPALRKAGRPRVVDLGCGSGLVAGALRGVDMELIGVDLSQEMLNIAEKRGAYGRLVKGDVVEELLRLPPATVTAVVSADVFIYVGGLEAVFVAAARALAPGGLFAFSIEGTDSGDYRLGYRGRYAHSVEYIRTLAAQNRMDERKMERLRIRREGHGYSEGWLAVFANPE